MPDHAILTILVGSCCLLLVLHSCYLSRATHMRFSQIESLLMALHSRLDRARQVSCSCRPPEQNK
jgi:hypothetical protein